jgi:putative flippase GtrA
MKDLWLKLYSKFRNLILYGIIGSSSALLDFTIFTVLTEVLDIYFLIANCISVTCGLTNSFILNRKYNFKVTDKTLKRALMFYTVGFCGLLVNSTLLYLFINYAHFVTPVAKICAMAIEVLLQFLVNSLITFRKTDYEKTNKTIG